MGTGLVTVAIPAFLAALGAAAAVAGGMASALRLRGRSRTHAPRVTPRDLGLRSLPPRGAFVQFSVPGSAPCRVALNRLAEAVSRHRDEAVVVELPLAGRRSLAERLEVRSAPTVLFVDAGGRVVCRWARPPERAELARVLEQPTPAPYAPAAAASR